MSGVGRTWGRMHTVLSEWTQHHWVAPDTCAKQQNHSFGYLFKNCLTPSMAKPMLPSLSTHSMQLDIGNGYKSTSHFRFRSRAGDQVGDCTKFSAQSVARVTV